MLELKRPCLDCYNRIILYDLIRHTELTNTGMEALRRSYKLSPYGEDRLMKRRLKLSSTFWHMLDGDLKQSALNQISVLSNNIKNREWLWNLKTDIPEIKEQIDILAL